MQRTDFKTQFLLQLNNVELPLDERLHIAHGALISQEFPLPGKEQVIIDWFAHCLKVNSSHPKGTMKKLIKCMKSDRLLTFCDAVDASKLIEVCIALDEDIKHRYSRLLVKLVLLLLKMPSFQRYCRFDILPMTQVMGLACDLLSRMDGSGVSLDDSTATESDEDLVTTGLEDLFSSILNIHKVTQQRDELKLRFVKTILPAILKLRFHFKNSTQFHILLEELIIGEDINTLCIAFKYYGKNETRHIPEYLKAIVNYIAQDDAQCDVITLNSVIFDVYVQTCLKLNETTTNHLTLFYILATRVGFKLELPYEVPIACNGSGPTLLVLGELVAVLQKYNISASTESEEGTLSNYLVVILKQLISEQYQMSADFLRTVYSIFQVYPESVKLVFFEFAKHIMFVSKENYEVSSVYDSLIEEVIKIYADLNQIEKFLSSFFHKAFLLQKEQDFRKLTCSTVLSNGVFKVFSEKLPSLTGNQLKTIIGRLEKIFLKNCIHVLESDSVIDSSFCLNVEMLVKVICFVLDNSCIAMPTRWNTLSEEISRLVLSVQRFGVAVLKSREIELLKGFLDLVRATAGIEMMMNQYVISLSSIKLLPTVKSVDKSGSVLNLARSHGYLTPPDWKRISELVVEFDDQQLNYCWYNLLLQKYFRCGDVEVMTHLVLNAGSVWLWEKVEYLSVGVPQKHLELYTDQLISADSLTAGQCVDRLAILGNVNVLKNRAFRVTMSLQVLNHVSKLIPDKSALSRKMMKLIDIESVVTSEVGEGSRAVDTIVDAVAEVMNKCPWNDQPLDLSDNVKEHLIKLMDLLTALRTYGLNIGTKQIIFLVLVGIAYDLRSQGGVLHCILQHILGLLDDGESLVADSVDRRVLVNWLALVVPLGYTARRQLAQLTVQKVVSTLDRCVDGMTSVLQADTDVLHALLETLTQVHESKTLKNKEEFTKLVRQLISLVSPVVLNKPKAKFLTVYTTALKAEYVYFKEKQPTLLQSLTVYLEILYKKLVEERLVESNATELIDFTLSTKDGIDPDIIKNVNRFLTDELCKVNPCPILCYPSTVKHFLESLPTDSFEDLLCKIYKNQHKSLTSGDGSCSVSSVCAKWNVVLSAQVDKDKLLLRHKMVARVLSDCLPLLEQDTASVEPVVLQLLHSISVSKSVILAAKLLDHILVIVGLAPTDSKPHLLPHALAVLGALLHSQSELIYDRIPAFLQRLRKLMISLVLVAAADSVDSVAYNNVITDSINQFSRIIKSIVDQHSKHFARIAPYLIADVLQFLSTHSIHPLVKEELRNSVCSLLTICDGYGNQLLQNLLSLGATELYKVISSTFRRSYKYTGKV